MLEFRPNPIFVSLFFDLKNHNIVGFTLPGGRLLIVNLIEQGYLLVAGTPMIF
jgi:hypothetical protein